VVGKEAEDLTRHDKWLCMMYPRLKLLQKLLSDDGAIFISIDDNEQANLKLICDEIFGAGNFVAEMPIHRQGGRQDSKYYAIVHEYLFCYAKRIESFTAGVQIKEGSVYPKYDENLHRYYKTQLLRKWGSNSLRENRPNLYYPIIAPDGTEVYPIIYSKSSNSEFQFDKIESCWRWGVSNMNNAIKEGRVEFMKNEIGDWVPYEKIFAPAEGECETKKYSSWLDEIGNGTKKLKEIFDGVSPFDYPKAVELLEMVLNMANSDKSSIILDSFAGSGTTAHAVLNLNKADGGNRKFILVEMEDYAETITAERVRRVIDGYGDTEGTGGSFDFYELGEPVFNEDGYLNENIGTEKLREYIWYTETRTPLPHATVETGRAPSLQSYNDNRKNETENGCHGVTALQYLLGNHNGTAYYFYYEKDQITTLDKAFLNSITQKAEQYVIYADNCLLSDDFMHLNNIIFKKIPRDVRKF
jgi:adenine-specific DNA-methyltransferase